MGILTYTSNNSGGNWWLSDKDWKALEDAGWVVHWFHDISQEHPDEIEGDDPHSWGVDLRHSHEYGDARLVRSTPDGKWLGASATSASIETDDPDLSISQWESLTGESRYDEGCNCCGAPHSFEFERDGKTQYLDTYPTNWSSSWL